MDTALIQLVRVPSSQYASIYLRSTSVIILLRTSWSSKWQLTKVSSQKWICINSLFPSIRPAHLSKRPRFYNSNNKKCLLWTMHPKLHIQLFLLSPNMFSNTMFSSLIICIPVSGFTPFKYATTVLPLHSRLICWDFGEVHNSTSEEVKVSLCLI